MTDIGTEAGRRLLARQLRDYDDQPVDITDDVAAIEAEARRAALDEAGEVCARHESNGCCDPKTVEHIFHFLVALRDATPPASREETLREALWPYFHVLGASDETIDNAVRGIAARLAATVPPRQDTGVDDALREATVDHLFGPAEKWPGETSTAFALRQVQRDAALRFIAATPAAAVQRL